MIALNSSVRRSVTLALVLLGLLVAAVSHPAAYADTQPPAPNTPATVSTDPLPTVQVDGVVWTQVVIGNTVYAGGSFATARPAGAARGVNTVPRSNFLAYDINTGALLPFAPAFNAQIRAMAISPDQKTLYVGGQFTQVNGVNRYRLIAFDVATGAAINTFTATTDATVYGLAATETTAVRGRHLLQDQDHESHRRRGRRREDRSRAALRGHPGRRVDPARRGVPGPYQGGTRRQLHQHERVVEPGLRAVEAQCRHRRQPRPCRSTP